MYKVEKKQDGFYVSGHGIVKRIYQNETDARDWVNRMMTWMESSDRIRRYKANADTQRRQA